MNTVVAKFPSWCGNCLTPCRVVPGNGSAEVWPPSAAPCRMRFAGLHPQLAAVYCTAQHIIHHASSDRERFHLMLECAPVIPRYCCALRCLGVHRYVGWTLLQGIGVRTGCCCFVFTVWHEAFNHVRCTAQQSLWTQLQTAVPRTTGGAGCSTPSDGKRDADMRGARATHMNARQHRTLVTKSWIVKCRPAATLVANVECGASSAKHGNLLCVFGAHLYIAIVGHMIDFG